MEPIEKLILGNDWMQVEVVEEPPVLSNRFDSVNPVTRSYVPQLRSTPPTPAICTPTPQPEIPVKYTAANGGKRVPVLLSMLSSACERNCHYCGCRAGRDFRRYTFHPEELAKLTSQLCQARIAEGIFLSSGIAGSPLITQDRLIETAEILRYKLNFQGYIHLKIMPGAQKAQVERAMQLADRVSVNLEAPNSAQLAKLAPQKVFNDELLQPLRWIEEIRREQSPAKAWKNRWASSVTQFVVDGIGETDLELLHTTTYLYRKLNLSRTYFSLFSPVSNTPLENLPPGNPWRMHRLYQASFLIRNYPFELEDLPFNQNGNLPLDTDPKMEWAKQHLLHNPIEINKASYAELVRIPGIGPKNAQLIVQHRLRHRLNSLEDLKNLGIHTKRVLPFILINGRSLTYQPAFW